MLTTRAGFYTHSEDLFASYDAYFDYLKRHPNSKIHKDEFHTIHPEYRPVSYHGPKWCRLTSVENTISIDNLGFRQVNFYDLSEAATLQDVCQSYLLDFRYGLNSIDAIDKAMREVEDPSEDRLPRMGFLPTALKAAHFQKSQLDALKEKLHSYSLTPDWGDDLAFYHESANYAMALIKSECSEARELFYINKDDLSAEMLSDSAVSIGYSFIIIAIDNSLKKMLVIDLGSD